VQHDDTRGVTQSKRIDREGGRKGEKEGGREGGYLRVLCVKFSAGDCESGVHAVGDEDDGSTCPDEDSGVEGGGMAVRREK
jgi:hypothetical protein